MIEAMVYDAVAGRMRPLDEVRELALSALATYRITCRPSLLGHVERLIRITRLAALRLDSPERIRFEDLATVLELKLQGVRS